MFPSLISHGIMIMVWERCFKSGGTQRHNWMRTSSVLTFGLPYSIYVIYESILLQEVFRTDIKESLPLSSISGKCHVMSVKHYFKQKPKVPLVTCLTSYGSIKLTVTVTSTELATVRTGFEFQILRGPITSVSSSL